MYTGVQWFFMGSSKKFDRDNAVDWVMHAIWQGGFESVSVKAVSEALGITRSSFYNAFKSREALFMEAIQKYGQSIAHANLSAFAESESPLALLTQVFKDTCTERTNDKQHRGCMVVNSVSELVGVNDKLGPFIENALKSSIDCIEALLESSVQRGELAKDTDTRQLALALENTLIGINTMSKVITSEQELWESTKSILLALKVYRE